MTEETIWSAIEAEIDAAFEEYEYGEHGYTPTEHEQALIQDFVAGILSEPSILQRAVDMYRPVWLPSPPAADKGE